MSSVSNHSDPPGPASGPVSGGRSLPKTAAGRRGRFAFLFDHFLWWWLGLSVVSITFIVMSGLTRNIDLSDSALFGSHEEADDGDSDEHILPGWSGIIPRGSAEWRDVIDNTATGVRNGTGSSDVSRRITDPPVQLLCARRPPRRTLQWTPRENRYLMMVCNYGRLGNRLWCINIYLVAAALLNRTLVFPVRETGYNYAPLYDLPRIIECLGNNTLISLDDLKILRHGNANVTMLKGFEKAPGFHNHFFNMQGGTGYFDDFAYATGVHFLKFEQAKYKSQCASLSEFLEQFDYEDEIISFGEGFIVDFGTAYWRHYMGEDPWITNCTAPVFRPDVRILEAAMAFTRTFLEPKYIAMHWRRSDFRSYCGGGEDRSCFHSIGQVANCVRKHGRLGKIDVLFVATDAKDDEFEVLQTRLQRGDWPMSVVRLPKKLPEKEEGLRETVWDFTLTKSQMDNANVQETIAMLDRVICAMSSTFLQTRMSTFSNEIKRLRRAWNLTGCYDEEICNGEKPTWVEKPWG